MRNLSFFKHSFWTTILPWKKTYSKDPLPVRRLDCWFFCVCGRFLVNSWGERRNVHWNNFQNQKWKPSWIKQDEKIWYFRFWAWYGPDTAALVPFFLNKNPANEKKIRTLHFFWNPDLKYWFFWKKQYKKNTFYLNPIFWSIVGSWVFDFTFYLVLQKLLVHSWQLSSRISLLIGPSIFFGPQLAFKFDFPFYLGLKKFVWSIVGS